MSSTASAGNSREVAETQGNKEPAKSPPSAKIVPLPRQTEQFPPPGKPHSRQVWVAISHLPTVSAILISFHITVKPRHPGRKRRAVDATRIAFVEGASL